MSCDDPDLLALAELRIQNDWRSPGADTVGFDSSTDAWAVLCIDVQRAASAWIAVNRQVAADPNDFDPKVTRVQARCRVRAGWNLLGGIVAGEPGSWLRVRVAADRRRAANVEQSDGGFGEGGQQPPAFGCTTAQAGLALPVLLLTALVLLARRSRPS